VNIRRRDAVGVMLSAACLMHCLLTPVLLASLPALGMSFAHGGFHAIFALLVLGAAALALVPGYRMHGHRSVLVLGVLGTLGVGSGAMLEHGALETGLTVAGSLLLVLGHAINLRFSRPHTHGPAEAQHADN
jgi:hypothetical protein